MAQPATVLPPSLSGDSPNKNMPADWTPISESPLSTARVMPLPQTATSKAGAESSPTKGTIMGSLLILTTALIFTADAYIFKLVAANYSVSMYELLMIRGILYTMVGALGMGWQHISPYSMLGSDLFFVLICATGFTIDTICYYEGMMGLDVSLASVVFCNMPVFVAILARLILKESLSLIVIVCIVFSICGTAMIMKQPAAVFGSSSQTSSMMGLYVGCMLLSDLCATFTGLVSRKISGQISFFVTTFYLGLLMYILYSLIDYFADLKTAFDVTKFFALLVSQVPTFIGQYVYYMAHQYSPAVQCSYYVFAQAILAFFGDMLILSISVDYIQVIGAVIILLCGIVITTHKLLSQSASQPASQPASQSASHPGQQSGLKNASQLDPQASP